MPDKTQGEPKKRNKGALKPDFAAINAPLTGLQKKIVASISSNPKISYDEMAQRLGKNRTTIMRNISRMKDMGLLVRVGSKKTGYWKVAGMSSSAKKGDEKTGKKKQKQIFPRFHQLDVVGRSWPTSGSMGQASAI